MAEEVLKTAIKYLPVALDSPENYAARANLMAISSVACSGIPMTLTELGINDEHFEKMAAHANVGGYLENSFVAMTNDDIVSILKDCI